MKVKIVLDADVLIHFSKANMLSLLPEILTEYDHVVLSTVYEEIGTIQGQLDNQIHFLKNIVLETFNPTGEVLKEYAMLKNTLGKGESACMAYCKFTNNVIGSSNLKDIKAYCERESITYLTTLDFLYYAYERKKLSSADCLKFITDVISKGSKLPNVDITKYIPSVKL